MPTCFPSLSLLRWRTQTPLLVAMLLVAMAGCHPSSGATLTNFPFAPESSLRTMAVSNGVFLEWPTKTGYVYDLEFSFDGESWRAAGEPRAGDGFYSAFDFSFPHKAAIEGRLSSQLGFAQVTFGNGIFLGRDGRGQSSVSSDGGVTWNRQSTVLPQARIVFGNGRFVTYQVGASHAIFLSSADGIFWVRRSVPGFVRALAFGDGSFFAVAEGRTWQSFDGVDWVSRVTTTDSHPMLDFAVGNGRLVLLRGHPGKANQAHVSVDHGESFRQERTAVVGEQICFGTGVFVSVGLSGKIVVSTNGVTWSARVTNAPPLYGVHCGPHGFVAVGEQGAVWRSTNGLNWSSSKLGENRLWNAASSPEATVFFGNFGGVITAGLPKYFRLRRGTVHPDSVISLVDRPADSNLPRSPYLDPNGDLILPGVPGKGYQLMTSADGLIWEPLGAIRSATGGIVRWPRSLLATGRNLFRVSFQDERRTLAEIYFGGGKGFAAAAALVAQKTTELAAAEEAVRTSRSVTDGNYFSQLEIMNQIYWLRWDDGVATNYNGVVKGRIARLSQDIVPFWTQELLKSQPFPEWKVFTTAAVTNNKLWLSIEQQQRTLLETHEASYVAGRALDFQYNIRNQKLNIIAQREYALSLERRWWASSLTNYGFPKQLLNLTTNSPREIALDSDVIDATGRRAPSQVHVSAPAAADVGESVILTARVQGAEPLTYQWQHNGSDIPGSTSSQLFLSQAKASHSGHYRVRVRNNLGEASSDAVVVQVRLRRSPPAVTGPGDWHALVGERVLLDPEVRGEGHLDYRWYHGGNLLPQETGPQLVIDRANATHAGTYRLVVVSDSGATTSRVANLWVGRPPVITLQPVPLTVVEGQSTRFVVEAEGEGPLAYQWRLNGSPISGADSMTWSLPQATAESAGDISVIVSNSAGVVTSEVVVLRVGVPPTIVRDPPNTTWPAGATARLAVLAQGTEPLQFQWFKDGLPLAQGSTAEFLQPLVRPAHAGKYLVVVSNWAGVAVSEAADMMIVSEAQLPRVEVVEPRPNARHGQEVIWTRGSATDNIAVAEVNVVLNGGPVQRAQGTTNWFYELRPQIGENSLIVWSVDGSGNPSSPVRRKFTYRPTAPLQLEIVGEGTVSPRLQNQLLELGRTYRLTAAPGPGHLFAGWTGGATATAPSVTFVMERGLALQARFMPNPFLKSAGTYEGLFFASDLPSAATAGFITLTVNKQGAFSGRFTSSAWRSSVRGTFDLAGRANLGLSSAVEADRAQLDILDSEHGLQITGELRRSGTRSEIRMGRIIDHAAVLPGDYRLSFIPENNVPASYGRVIVNARGGLSLRLELTPQERLVRRAGLNEQGRWAFFAPLARGQGALLGWLEANFERNEVSGYLTGLGSGTSDGGWMQFAPVFPASDGIPTLGGEPFSQDFPTGTLAPP